MPRRADLNAFGEGHKGAGGTPVNSGSALEVPGVQSAMERAGVTPEVPTERKPRQKVVDADNGGNIVEDSTPITEEDLARQRAGSRGKFVAENPTATVDSRAGKAKRTREVAPTNRTPGAHVPQTLGITDLETKIQELHTALKSHANQVGSFKLRPEAASHVGNAHDDLDNAMYHYKQAQESRRGVMTTDPVTGKTKRISGDADAGKHYLTALSYLNRAHSSLAQPEVKAAAGLNNATAELPTDKLQELQGHAKNVRILKGGAPLKMIPFGGTTVNPKHFDLKSLEKEYGKEHPAVQKIRAAQQGLPRQDTYLVASGKQAPVAGTAGASDAPRAGRNGMTRDAVNPKRRASSSRRIETKLSGANMSAYATPTREEGPEIGSDVSPKLPAPTGKSLSSFNTPEVRAKRAKQGRINQRLGKLTALRNQRKGGSN
jgi:hypothetical protein